MKTLMRLIFLALLLGGAVFFFTFKMKGKRVEIEMKEVPGFQEVKETARDAEKKAIRTGKELLYRKNATKPHATKPNAFEPIEEEPTEEDRETLRKIIREKSGEK